MLLRTYTIPSDSTCISEHKKCRPSADVYQAPAIYGLFHYAHRSQYCINPKHLCSQRRSPPHFGIHHLYHILKHSNFSVLQNSTSEVIICMFPDFKYRKTDRMFPVGFFVVFCCLLWLCLAEGKQFVQFFYNALLFGKRRKRDGSIQ